MLQLQLKQSTHYSSTHIMVFLIQDFMLAHMHAKTSNVYSEQCRKISDFQSETTKPTIIIKI